MEYTCSSCGAVATAPLVYCRLCGGWHTYGAWPRKAHHGAIPDTALCSARDLARGGGSYLGLPVDVREVVGDLPTGLWGLVLFGSPGTLKSTSALILADALCRVTGSPVLYNSLEEGHGQALGARLRRLEIRRPELLIGCLSDLGRVLTEARRLHVAAIVFDSWSYMKNVDSVDIARLQRESESSTVVVLHAIKNGGHKGSMSILHAADVVVECLPGGRFRRSKSRFSESTEGDIPWAAPAVA